MKLSNFQLWNMPKLPSMTSMFSSFSLSNMFGMGSSSAAQTPTSGPPPGLENVVLTPPPGLGFPSSKTDEVVSFADAPMLSNHDVREKRERIEAAQKQKNQVVEANKVSRMITWRRANPLISQSFDVVSGRRRVDDNWKAKTKQQRQEEQKEVIELFNIF